VATSEPVRVRTEDLLRSLAPQVLGALVRRYGHFDAAEDTVQEALIAAARQWPTDGTPGNPRAWLIRMASRRLTDELRSAGDPAGPLQSVEDAGGGGGVQPGASARSLGLSGPWRLIRSRQSPCPRL
jgi:DNA-directed RNA polymerase specialized sigma24 family protein